MTDRQEESSHSLGFRVPIIPHYVSPTQYTIARPPCRVVLPATRFVVVFKVYKLLCEDAVVHGLETSNGSTAPEFWSPPARWMVGYMVDRTF